MRTELTIFCGKAHKHSSTHWNFGWTEIQVVSLPAAWVNPAFLKITMETRIGVKNDGETTRLNLTLCEKIKQGFNCEYSSFLYILEGTTREGPDLQSQEIAGDHTGNN